MPHKRITFAKGTLGRFLKKYGLTMATTEVPAIIICRVQTHPGEKFFILTFRTTSGRLLKIPYSQGGGVEGYPEIGDVLGGLARDIMLYLEYPTPEEYGDAFGIPMEEWEEHFDRLQAVANSTTQFLGEAAYDELLQMAQDPDRFEMEGAMSWQRSLTCGQ